MEAKKFLVADTETLGLSPKNIVYDFAYTIATRKAVLLERSFLIREILCDPVAMLGAIDDKHWRQTFGGKVFSHYIPAIDDSRLKLYSWFDILQILRDDMRTHNVQVFCAYNINFDMRALQRTHQRIVASGKILEYRPDLLDLWLFSTSTALNSPLYHDVATRQGWVSDAGNYRTTAEKTYAYLTGDYDFIESHTALEDAQIETEILQRLLAKKKTIPYNDIQHMPWKHAQKTKGKLF